MCGDSTSIDDVSRLCGDAKIDLLLTDPPYGVDYKGKAGKIENDDLHGEEFTEFLTSAFENAARVMRPGATFYVWFADLMMQNFYTALTAAGLKYSEMLLWVKNAIVLGHADYQRKHEPCLAGTLGDASSCELSMYGWKEGAGHTFRYNRKQSTVLEFPKPLKSSLHPTMKPVPLWDYLIKAGTAAGDNVLDLFTGSGTTLIACEQNGRHAFCMEKDPHYASAAVARWEAFTGKKAVKVN